MRITIKGLFFIVMLFAVLFAALAGLRTAPDYSQRFTLASNLFGLGAFTFLFHSAISILYRDEDQRAFWVGCTLACASLMFVEPRFENGMDGLCTSVAKYAVITTSADYNANSFRWKRTGAVIRS